MKNRKKTKKENRVVTQCRKCNKPFSYDVNKGWKHGELCSECATKNK